MLKFQQAFSPCHRKSKVSLRHYWICIILPLSLKAESNTQRNTYKSCKLHCIQWKNELWCYGNPKQQQLQEWMLVNLIQQKEETGVKYWPVLESQAITAISMSLCGFVSDLHLQDVICLHLVCEGDQDMDDCQADGLCAYMSRLPGADMDLSSLRLGHSKGLLKERFLSMARTKIWNIHAKCKRPYFFVLCWDCDSAQKIQWMGVRVMQL